MISTAAGREQRGVFDGARPRCACCSLGPARPLSSLVVPLAPWGRRGTGSRGPTAFYVVWCARPNWEHRLATPNLKVWPRVAHAGQRSSLSQAPLISAPFLSVGPSSVEARACPAKAAADWGWTRVVRVLEQQRLHERELKGWRESVHEPSKSREHEGNPQLVAASRGGPWSFTDGRPSFKSSLFCRLENPP